MLDFAARVMPPPKVVGLPLRLAPASLPQRALVHILNQVLADRMDSTDSERLEGRTLAIVVIDMKFKCVLGFCDGRWQLPTEPVDNIDATVRGCVGDLLMLAAQLEDPDTLFFERRLEVIGDTATSLLIRNLLDRIPFEALPLPPRIVLNRLARFSRRLRTRRLPD